MAFAKRRTKTITVKKIMDVDTVVPNGVTLDLTEDEAKTLWIVFQKIGGSPTESLRGHCSVMLEALRQAGVSVPHPDYVSTFNNDRSYISFKEGATVADIAFTPNNRY